MRLLLLAILCISAPLQAELVMEQKPGGGEAVAPPWELYDTNEDGYISLKEAEAQKMSSQIFNSLDIDRDGRLNKEEFSKAPRIRLE
jgi:Ca2+-binding EF-hand superfamily protein